MNGNEINPGPPANPGRRQFFQTASALGAGVAFAGMAEAQDENKAAGAPAPHMDPLPMTNTGPDQIPQRALGKTGANVSILGMGGHHLGDPKSVDEAMPLVSTAIDAGITFFDNCWEYHNGKSEDWLGRALVGKR